MEVVNKKIISCLGTRPLIYATPPITLQATYTANRPILGAGGPSQLPLSFKDIHNPLLISFKKRSSHYAQCTYT